MAIKRYFSNKDNTITDAFRSDLVTRGTGSNMGASDILEVFSIYGQANSSSVEKTRFLIEFPMSGIEADRTANVIPAAGNVEFYLKLYNAKHPFTLPSQYDLNILAISSSWQEGVGLDMEEYRDLTYDQLGCNWIKRSGSTSWTSEGGDFHASPIFSASFPVGNEDLEVDVTSLVEEWLLGSKENYGFAIKLPDALETGQLSYYTKKFFSRSSEFFYKRPQIEARWRDFKGDDRNNFYLRLYDDWRRQS